MEVDKEQYLTNRIISLEELVNCLEEELNLAIHIIEDSGMDFEEVKQSYLED